MPTIDVFLTGHGFTATRANRSIGEITIPAGLTLYFYCPANKLYDSQWEQDIHDGKTVGPGYQYVPRVHGADEPEITVFAAGKKVPESILTRPGNLASLVKFVDQKEITNGGNPENSVVPALADKTSYAVKAKDTDEKSYVYLSGLLTAIAAKKGANTVRVHWCACRSNLTVNEHKRVVDEDVLEQAKSMPKAPLARH